MRSRDAASDACRRTSSATCSAGAAWAASESSSRLSSVEYCWSESRGPRFSVPTSSPPDDERHDQRHARRAQRVDGRRLELEPLDLDHAACGLEVGEQRVVGRDLHGRADRQVGREDRSGLAAGRGGLGRRRVAASADHPAHRMRERRHLTVLCTRGASRDRYGFSLRSQIETWAGCIVSRRRPQVSAERSSSTCSRSRAPNASSVRCAS